jgi:hypothetical protein
MDSLSSTRGLLQLSVDGGSALGEPPEENRKIRSATSERERLDELYLVVYYNSAILYNTPYDTPGFGFRDVGEVASQQLSLNPGQFQKVFLFSPIEKNGKVLEIWPRPNYLGLNNDKSETRRS